MANIISRIWRLISILAAMAGALLAGLTVYFLLSRASTGNIAGFGVLLPELKAFIAAWFSRAGIYVPVAALIAAAIILVTELTEIREWVVHATAGAFCAALTLFIVLDLQVIMTGSQIAMMVQSVVAAFVAGIAYWAVAGRTAGRWRL